MIQSPSSLRAQRGNPSCQAVGANGCIRRLIAAASPRNDGVKYAVVMNLIQDLAAMLGLSSNSQIAGLARNDKTILTVVLNSFQDLAAMLGLRSNSQFARLARNEKLFWGTEC